MEDAKTGFAERTAERNKLRASRLEIVGLRDALVGHPLDESFKDYVFAGYEHDTWPKYDGTTGRSGKSTLSIFKKNDANSDS